MRKNPKYHTGSKCKFCGKELEYRKGIPKPHQKYYFTAKYYCTVCKLAFTNNQDKSFLKTTQPDIFRKTKQDTGIHRQFRSMVMEWFRGLKSEQKPEVIREFKSFMEMWPN